MSKNILVWFRNDLRLHDNEMLVEAIAKSNKILPIYIFDIRQFQQTPYNTLKTGWNRTQLILENVSALRSAFIQKGGNLLIKIGIPEEIIPAVAEQNNITEVYHHREVAIEETTVSSSVEDKLWKLKINLKHFIGHTLYNKEDLPFPIKDIPDVFTQFKKKTEREALIKPCFETPEKMDFLYLDDWGAIPSIQDLYPNTLITQQFLLEIKDKEVVGGETDALAYLDQLLSDSYLSGMSNKDYYSSLSAWLSLGSLSPRMVYWKLKNIEPQNKTLFQKILVGLFWRDYYRFMFKKHGNKYFHYNGFQSPELKPLDVDFKTLNNWKTGATGQPEVDLIMHTLNTKGYITFPARALAASYLVQVLNVNWTFGAAYFEEQLLDYCPASNWGNWAQLAGVGNDPKINSQFEFNTLLKGFENKKFHIASSRI